MSNQWDDWMPTPCAECGGIWDLNEMYPDPRDRRRNLVCPECKDDIESALDSGVTR